LIDIHDEQKICICGLRAGEPRVNFEVKRTRKTLTGLELVVQAAFFFAPIVPVTYLQMSVLPWAGECGGGNFGGFPVVTSTGTLGQKRPSALRISC
jgi:hypothetical protein